MFKDRNHTEQTAYELLGLPFDASLSEVQAALKRFMRERRRELHLFGTAQQAQKKLQSPAARAGVDIWLYDIELSDVPNRAAPVPDLDNLSRPRAFPPSELYCVVADPEHTAPKREIITQKIKFSEVRSFDNVDSLELLPKFDR